MSTTEHHQENRTVILLRLMAARRGHSITLGTAAAAITAHQGDTLRLTLRKVIRRMVEAEFITSEPWPVNRVSNNTITLTEAEQLIMITLTRKGLDAATPPAPIRKAPPKPTLPAEDILPAVERYRAVPARQPAVVGGAQSGPFVRPGALDHAAFPSRAGNRYTAHGAHP